MACLPDALDRALKVIRRPESSGDDVLAAILLLLKHGTPSQRRQYAAAAGEPKQMYPDYAAFLELKWSQESPEK